MSDEAALLELHHLWVTARARAVAGFAEERAASMRAAAALEVAIRALELKPVLVRAIERSPRVAVDESFDFVKPWSAVRREAMAAIEKWRTR